MHYQPHPTFTKGSSDNIGQKGEREREREEKKKGG